MSHESDRVKRLYEKLSKAFPEEVGPRGVVTLDYCTKWIAAHTGKILAMSAFTKSSDYDAKRFAEARTRHSNYRLLRWKLYRPLLIIRGPMPRAALDAIWSKFDKKPQPVKERYLEAITRKAELIARRSEYGVYR